MATSNNIFRTLVLYAPCYERSTARADENFPPSPCLFKRGNGPNRGSPARHANTGRPSLSVLPRKLRLLSGRVARLSEGARAGRLRCVSTRTITIGYSIAAKIFSRPHTRNGRRIGNALLSNDRKWPTILTRHDARKRPDVSAHAAVGPGGQNSVCSEISNASSTWIPRCRTVDSSFVWPRSSRTAPRFFVLQ